MTINSLANKRIYFIAGTDTDVGKTYITSLLLQAAVQQGYKALGIKPVATGCDPQSLKNADVQLLQANSNVKVTLPFINFPSAVAPNIAAKLVGEVIHVSDIVRTCQKAFASDADFILVEGTGGWLCPLNEQGDTMASIAKALNLDIILVVGLRLGCLNHALLTAHAIAAAQLNIKAWIANEIDPNMQCIDENIACLQAYLSAPLLSKVAYESKSLSLPTINFLID